LYRRSALLWSQSTARSHLCSYTASLLLSCICPPLSFFFFFFNDTATTEIYTLSLHDALPIFALIGRVRLEAMPLGHHRSRWCPRDRKSTRLNSSHVKISYAVFCLKKKKKKTKQTENKEEKTIGRHRKKVETKQTEKRYQAHYV